MSDRFSKIDFIAGIVRRSRFSTEVKLDHMSA
jgi:hypothetical protein